MHASHRMLLDHEGVMGVVVSDKIKKFKDPIVFWIQIRAISRGIEPISV